MLHQYKFIQTLSRLQFVEEIWLYGSRARGDNHDRSDIDLAILCPSATKEDWQQVLEIIDDADTLLHVDCVRFDKLTTTDKLRENILKFKKILYRKNG